MTARVETIAFKSKRSIQTERRDRREKNLS